jgi:ketosteroid isomerase-like protein
MRKLVLISSLFASVLVVRPAFAAGSDEKAVLAALDSWKAAMLAKDRAALEKIFHPDITYAHSSAAIQTKAEAIKGAVEGMGWEKIELSDTTVRLLGKVAIVNGKVDMYERHKDKNTTSKLVMLSVWTKAPQGWQMIARQAVRRPDDDQVIAAKAALTKVASPPAAPAK